MYSVTIFLQTCAHPTRVRRGGPARSSVALCPVNVVSVLCCRMMELVQVLAGLLSPHTPLLLSALI